MSKITTNTINWELCLERASGREDMAKEMLVAIIDELPIHKQDLINAFSNRDVKKLGTIAHTLNGLCCYSGLPQLKVAAQGLEQEVLGGRNKDLSELYYALIDNVEKVIDIYNSEFNK